MSITIPIPVWGCSITESVLILVMPWIISSVWRVLVGTPFVFCNNKSSITKLGKRSHMMLSGSDCFVDGVSHKSSPAILFVDARNIHRGVCDWEKHVTNLWNACQPCLQRHTVPDFVDTQKSFNATNNTWRCTKQCASQVNTGILYSSRKTGNHVLQDVNPSFSCLTPHNSRIP